MTLIFAFDVLSVRYLGSVGALRMLLTTLRSVSSALCDRREATRAAAVAIQARDC